MYNILICDDEPDIVSALKIYLTGDEYQLFEAYNGRQALETVDNNEIHLVLLDIMMPEMDGIQTLSRIREHHNMPVIFLTAKGEDTDKILGLNIGADDYVTKPFTPMELLARVNSQLRRYRMFAEKLRDREENQNIHVIGGLELNEDTVEVSVDGELVRLTPIEYKILLLLMKSPGRVFSAEEIYERVWNEKAINTDTIMVHIRNIREKIESCPKEPKYLKVVWGVGYKIEKQA